MLIKAEHIELVALGLVALALLLMVRLTTDYRPVPQCEEDAVVLGVGKFEHGRWEGYVCGPSIDFVS